MDIASLIANHPTATGAVTGAAILTPLAAWLAGKKRRKQGAAIGLISGLVLGGMAGKGYDLYNKDKDKDKELTADFDTIYNEYQKRPHLLPRQYSTLGSWGLTYDDMLAKYPEQTVSNIAMKKIQISDEERNRLTRLIWDGKWNDHIDVSLDGERYTDKENLLIRLLFNPEKAIEAAKSGKSVNSVVLDHELTVPNLVICGDLSLRRGNPYKSPNIPKGH